MTSDGLDMRAAVDEAVREWRQGDFVLGEMWFVFQVDPALPLSFDVPDGADFGEDVVMSEVPGFMIVSQTCDIVRATVHRPFVQVCPLVAPSPDEFELAQRGRIARYAYIPELRGEGLVGDLDRCMTVEKAVVAGWVRHQGCVDDVQRRQLAAALARSRSRPALPDDFRDWIARYRKRVIEKHGKQNDEGSALRAIDEVRVLASPSWEEPTVSISFIYILNDDLDPSQVAGVESHVVAWHTLLTSGSRFSLRSHRLGYLDDFSALEYLSSDLLDVDHVSRSGG